MEELFRYPPVKNLKGLLFDVSEHNRDFITKRIAAALRQKYVEMITFHTYSSLLNVKIKYLDNEIKNTYVCIGLYPPHTPEAGKISCQMKLLAGVYSRYSHEPSGEFKYFDYLACFPDDFKIYIVIALFQEL